MIKSDKSQKIEYNSLKIERIPFNLMGLVYFNKNMVTLKSQKYGYNLNS